MKVTWKDMLHGAFWGGALGAVIGLGTWAAPTAHAVDLDANEHVTYEVCGNGVAEIEYVNVYGNFTEVNRDLSTGCWRYDMFTGRDEYGLPAGTPYGAVIASDDNGGAISCRILVDKTVASEAHDTSDYYAWVSCD